LRNERSLIQTMGRAARNEDGHVIFYGDRVTGSMQRAMTVTRERRIRQQEHNAEHGIVPTTVRREVEHPLAALVDRTKAASESEVDATTAPPVLTEVVDLKELPRQISRLQKEMRAAAVALEFEEAAILRDRLRALQEQLLIHGRSVG
jgi:excinuclease ABC subunit B